MTLDVCPLPGKIESLSVPKPAPGQVLIRVKAFGLNRSELFTRQGHSPSVRFPRVLGIEAVGTVEDALGGEFRKAIKNRRIGRLLSAELVPLCAFAVKLHILLKSDASGYHDGPVQPTAHPSERQRPGLLILFHRIDDMIL